MLADVKNWDISDEDSASDHNIIKYSIRLDNYTSHDNNPTEPRYRIKEHQLTKFKMKLQYNITKIFQMEEKERYIDEELSSQVNENTDIGQFTVKLEKAIHTTCNEICRQKNPTNTEKKGRTVPGGR